MNINLEGKVALITASTAGIGLAIAKALYDAGASVAICGRSEDRLQTAQQELNATPERLFSLAGDVSDAKFIETFVEQAASHFHGRVDILVNNSGGPTPGEALSKTDADWTSALENNFLSVVRMCRLVVPLMKANNYGRIVNLTSTAAREPAPGMVLSNATRAAVAAYSKTLAHEIGQFGITVNTILTGGVLTARLDSLLQKKVEGTDQTMEEAIAEIAKTIPVRHIAAPEEFAQTVLFLVSDQAAYLTGTAIPLDGGASKSLF